jgi:hypothetical protein
MIPTCDPHVWIEAQGEGVVRYRRDDGRRWEVHGTCTHCGRCWEGAVDPRPELDCPVTPEFDLCDEFDFVELERVD